MFNVLIQLILNVLLLQVPDPALIVECGQNDTSSEDVTQHQSSVREDLSKVIYVLNRSPSLLSDLMGTGLEEETDDGVQKVGASQELKMLSLQMTVVRNIYHQVYLIHLCS